ncbi:hypothetical protein K474DRAFT_1634730 [Panus rudis PR-1116 ss-1]|nr:hypothetical protein K474DRAFT_1634730 [Panus rudis PR-1116 ss-1]
MATTLAEHADRLSELASAIRANAVNTAHAAEQDELGQSTAGPFTRAILKTPLGDLIREIDETELGLLTLEQPSQPLPSHAQDETIPPTKAAIERVQFPGATPLRKPSTRRDEFNRPREHEPEVYAQAALKYLDRYHSIRPMPRASEQAENIIEQLAAVRKNIHELSETLKQVNVAGPSSPPLSSKSAAKQEEHRIREIQAEIQDLKQRKEALLKKRTGIRTANKLAPPRSKPKPPPPTSPDAQENSFWNTPAANARTLHFADDLLTDEHMDLGDVSALASPIPDSRSGPPRGLSRPGLRAQETGRSHEVTLDCTLDVNDTSIPTSAPSILAQLEAAREASPEPVTSVDESDDFTVRIQPQPSSAREPVEAPVESTALAAPPSEDLVRKAKLKVTTELELIVSRIWSSMGEIIMPGHPFDVNGTGGPKPPHAKETISHLQSLSSQTINPTSPSTSISSLATAPPPSGQPSTQQILIAHVLLALLTSPPSYSKPLNKLKEVVAEKSPGQTAMGTAVTRPIYACVAKKLLKIDRSGREQIVKFDL